MKGKQFPELSDKSNKEGFAPKFTFLGWQTVFPYISPWKLKTLCLSGYKLKQQRPIFIMPYEITMKLKRDFANTCRNIIPHNQVNDNTIFLTKFIASGTNCFTLLILSHHIMEQRSHVIQMF